MDMSEILKFILVKDTNLALAYVLLNMGLYLFAVIVAGVVLYIVLRLSFKYLAQQIAGRLIRGLGNIYDRKTYATSPDDIVMP